eukprot:6465310-Amphidinium_carterae.1
MCLMRLMSFGGQSFRIFWRAKFQEYVDVPIAILTASAAERQMNVNAVILLWHALGFACHSVRLRTGNREGGLWLFFSLVRTSLRAARG